MYYKIGVWRQGLFSIYNCIACYLITIQLETLTQKEPINYINVETLHELAQ